MIDNIEALPVEFYCGLVILVFGYRWSISQIRFGIGIPSIAVLTTVAVWYFVDVMYNGYINSYLNKFPPEVMDEAWWQVIAFLSTFVFLTPYLHRRLNHRFLRFGSSAYRFYKIGVDNKEFQKGLSVIFRATFVVWMAIVFFAFFRYDSKILSYLFPELLGHPGPWNLSGIGGGSETLFSLANYLQLMVGSIFGVVAALSRDTRIRRFAFICVLLVWPFYIFDRTRKFILVIALPGFLAWLLLRFRRGFFVKIAVTLSCFLVVNAWFGFIIENRSTSSVTGAFFDGGFDFSKSSVEQHQGLNMFEELNWIVKFKRDKIFDPEIGANYFANLVNPIPRGLWPGKPTIGLDYAIARGAELTGVGAGVSVTLSNGLIGQGVINFGLYFGAAFAAFLMSIWAVLLARIDLLGQKMGYLPLFGLGLILTFTMGRDITFLELYPFFFGYGICWFINNRFSISDTETDG